jgi:hypothetical protein
MRFSALKRGLSAFNKATPPNVKLFLVLFASCVALFVLVVVSDWYDNYKAAHLSSADQLERAEAICPKVGRSAFACSSADPDNAISHLGKIPKGAPEYGQAAEMTSSLRAWQQLLQKRLGEALAEQHRIANQSNEEASQQYLRNTAGEARDRFECGTSMESTPIMSFDYKHHWWADDGRCAAQEEAQQQAKQEAERQQREAEQKKLDEDAQLESYWPTTLRVDTDMDSFWFNDEERTCQTYPDSKGRVAVVACNAGGTHRDRNIPVRFWGGVDRNTISNWRCRRESDQFVCKALD